MLVFRGVVNFFRYFFNRRFVTPILVITPQELADSFGIQFMETSAKNAHNVEQVEGDGFQLPIGSMGLVYFTYIWLIFMVIFTYIWLILMVYSPTFG